ncbi:MAG: SDR family oxidoreductase [Erythrobacter sp.]|jgi:NAD(P)-dependent dehydrogenase (short-subunit alcohol dehydrogenase family)|nr:SDR family oxidoreductase [Erythrobacter sp.]
MARPAILVTGGATRIGAAIVRRFAQHGWHAVIHYRSSDKAANALARSLPSAETIACDLADGDAAEAMILGLAGRLPDWRALVNSASIFEYDAATKLDAATNQEAMQVNAVSPARMGQAYLRAARSKGIRALIQITDMKLANPNPDFFSYTMSKHAHASTVAMLAKHYRREASVRVYGLAPGAILASHDQSEDETELSHRLNLLKRKTGADEIAAAAIFMAQGTLRSGSSLFVDSGQHLLDQPRDVIYLARETAAGRA